MHRIAIIMVALLVLVGCGPNPSACQADIEAERVVLAYEQYFGGIVTESQRLCVHDFVLSVESSRHLSDRCRTDERLLGCVLFDPGTSAHIYINRIQRLDEELLTLRHELTHVLLNCVDPAGAGDPFHTSPEFGGNDHDDPGSLPWWAGRTDPGGYMCMF